MLSESAALNRARIARVNAGKCIIATDSRLFQTTISRLSAIKVCSLVFKNAAVIIDGAIPAENNGRRRGTEPWWTRLLGKHRIGVNRQFFMHVPWKPC